MKDKYLASYAVKNSSSKGRKIPETDSGDRTIFQKDRDRIIHCRAFRRLNLKTQVFVANYGDHYRTRLTHTIEVAQIARDISRSLNLNEDLAEAIALAHDLGHTPFGHAGEVAMNKCMAKYGKKFEHNEQSKRVVTEIENVYPDFRGLNLSLEVLEGLAKHQTPWDNPGVDMFIHPSLEAQVVNLADEIAYSNHDLDDGLRAGLITWDQLAELELLSEALAKTPHHGDPKVRKARLISTLMGMMISDVLATTKKNLERIHSLQDVYDTHASIVTFSDEFRKKTYGLKSFLYKNFYLHPDVLSLSKRGEKVIIALFDHYLENLDEIPEDLRGTDDVTAVKDYVSGMTDVFARKKAAELGVSY